MTGYFRASSSSRREATGSEASQEVRVGEDRGGLAVDATVRRGSFTLTVAFEVPPGQVLGVLGPNGAGKTTLLRALAGLTPVAGGRVTLDGQVVDDAATGTFVDAARRPAGYVFQDYRLFPHLSVAEGQGRGQNGRPLLARPTRPHRPGRPQARRAVRGPGAAGRARPGAGRGA